MENHLKQRGILTRDQLASELGLKIATVAEWEKRGMPSIREGKTVFYAIDDVIAWMRKRSRKRRAA